MTVRGEKRQAARATVNIPTVVEVIGQREQALHPAIAAVYERVKHPTEHVGKKFPAVLRDLSSNGAFISGPVLPLLSRVAFTFPLEGHGQVECLGWVLWRRSAACEVPRDGDEPLRLPAGIGLLFESIPLESRQFINRLVLANGRF